MKFTHIATILAFGAAALIGCTKPEATKPFSVELKGENPLQFEASETKEIEFVINGVKTSCETSVVLPAGWTGRVSEKSRGGADSFVGKIKVTAPSTDKDEEGDLVFEVSVPETGDMKSVTMTVAVKHAPDFSVRLSVDAQAVIVAPGEGKTLNFKATMKEPQELTAAIEVDNTAWEANVNSFAASGLEYNGVMSFKAPSAAGTAKATLQIKNAKAEVVASTVINLSAATISVEFKQPADSYDASKKYTIEFETNYTGTLKASAAVSSKSARVDNVTVGLNEGGTASVGSIVVWTGAFADDILLTLKLTDESKTVNEFVLPIKVSGGAAVPQAKKAANCIVVDKAGAVSFAACKGDGTAVKGGKAVLVWKDNENLMDESSLKFDGSNITFNTASTFAKGNALVALVDSGNNVMWSWHIWFVQGLNLNAPAGTFMNMNLGATDSAKNPDSFGYFYQWGRKDPFPGPKDFEVDGENPEDAFSGKNDRPTYLSSGYAWGVINKDVNFKNYDELAKYPTKMTTTATSLPASLSADIWGPETDPCPKGWRVPNHRELSEHWNCYSATAANKNAGGSTYGWGTSPAQFSTEWWPAPGCRMGDTGIRDWGGALRLVNYSGEYWSCTSSHAVSTYDSEADVQELGYISAAHISWNGSYYISLDIFQKNHASSVRCIKE